MNDKWRELYAEECQKTLGLEQQLAAEREARQRAERRNEDWRKGSESLQAQCNALTARAEQTERERDEALAELADTKRTLAAHHEKAAQMADDVLSAHAARERAEAELSEARRISRDMGAIISDTMTALEGEPDDNMIGLARALVADLKRAEADNTALLVELRDAVAEACVDGAGKGSSPLGALSWQRITRMEALTNEPHPGAARLEELSVLREVRQACEPFRAYASGQGGLTDGACKTLVAACAKADALKGGGA